MTVSTNTMKTFINACAVADLGEGEVKGCKLDGGVEVAVYRVRGQIFATHDECSHGRTPLSEGELDGYEVVCPLHHGSFDIRTGAAVGLPCIKSVKTYEVRLEEDQILIGIED